MSGGGQERGMRSGTNPTALAVGLGAAATVCAQEMAADTAHVTHLSTMMHQQINAKVLHTAMPKLRIGLLRFGTGRQKMVLAR
jgi:cysteine desulfurase